jgi:hypothetical protein
MSAECRRGNASAFCLVLENDDMRTCLDDERTIDRGVERKCCERHGGRAKRGNCEPDTKS